MYSPSKYDIWDIDLNTDILASIDVNQVDMTNTILALISFLNKTNISFTLDTDKKEFSLVETFLHNIAEFHINRLNNETKEPKKYYPVFWSKERSYISNFIHTHIDHCDYEKTIYRTEDNHPVYTTITYFSDNDTCPTVLTDITRYMCNNNKFNHKLNKKLVLVLPRILRHFGFTGGTNMHGEGYLNNDTFNVDRKTIVLTLWETQPLISPIFNSDIFYAYIFNNPSLRSNTSKPLKDICRYKNTCLINMHTNQLTIKKIEIENDEIFNTNFFDSLVIRKHRDTLFKLKPFIDSNLPDISVIEFNIVHHNTWKQISKINPLIKSGLSNWKINISIDNYDVIYKNIFTNFTFIHENLINYYIFDSELLFDMQSDNYNQEEEYIYFIAKYHIDRVTQEMSETGHNVGEIYVSFYINNKINNSLNMSNDNTIQTIVTSLENNDDYSLITSINQNMNKYKQIENSNIAVVYNKNSHVSFSGNYYNKYGKNTLIIRLWNNPPQNISKYCLNSNNKLNIKRKIVFKIEENNNDVTPIVLDPTIYKHKLLQEIVYNNNIDNKTISTVKSNNNICIFTPSNISIGTHINTTTDIISSKQSLRSIIFNPPNNINTIQDTHHIDG